MAAISCPHCSQPFDVPDDTPAKSVRCPHCHQSLAPGNAAVVSGEPPARPASTPDGDEALPPNRRDIAKRSSPWGPIFILGAAVALVLCVCAVPALFFFGAFRWFAVARQEAIHEAEAVRVAEKNADVAEMAKAQDPIREQQGFAKGVAEAVDAIAKDKLLLKEYPPLPAPAWHGDYIKLLREHCKCDYQVINAANLPKDQVAKIKGWNETMTEELKRRHGQTIIADLHAEAEKRWRGRIEPKEKK
jgi:hypothetical protein